MLDWLLTPISGASVHTISAWASWHGRCMVLAWGVLLPLGALAARYFKVLDGQDWPRELDHKAWWHAHRALQWGGVVALGIGLALAWGRGGAPGTLAAAHHVGGWIVVAAAAVQVASGLARGTKGGPTAPTLRGDHYDMTLRRAAFERLHKGLGWLALMGGVPVLVLGLVVADAPRWMPVLLAAWWLALGRLAWGWQRQGRCIDTYQAIWGPDPAHPGNHRAPIGWGVRRRRARRRNHRSGGRDPREPAQAER